MKGFSRPRRAVSDGDFSSLKALHTSYMVMQPILVKSCKLTQLLRVVWATLELKAESAYGESIAAD
jgi:hypothetical protein